MCRVENAWRARVRAELLDYGHPVEGAVEVAALPEEEGAFLVRVTAPAEAPTDRDMELVLSVRVGALLAVRRTVRVCAGGE